MDARGMETGIMGDNKNCFEKRCFIKNDNLIKFEEHNLKFDGFEQELMLQSQMSQSQSTLISTPIS